MNSPTLNPFPSRSGSGSSAGALVITALILGIATAAAVFFLKMPKHSEESSSADNPLTGIFSDSRSDNSKDWDFYTAEIDNVLLELRTAKENYEAKSKALLAELPRLEAEREDLARVRREIETLRSQLSEDIRKARPSNAPTSAIPPTPQQPQ